MLGSVTKAYFAKCTKKDVQQPETLGMLLENADDEQGLGGAYFVTIFNNDLLANSAHPNQPRSR